MIVTFDFAGPTAVVSGAAQGIGLALAQMFSKAGARVAVTDCDGEQWKAVLDVHLDRHFTLPVRASR